MSLIYLAGVTVYGWLIFLFSFFNKKAALWVDGRKNQLSKIENSLAGNKEKRIWFHCASLGEFEQGKPVMQAMRKEYPHFKIVVTFFSPSGYEVRKKDAIADYVFYLPLDSPANAKKFIAVVNPILAFFIKYDFWHFYIKELKDKKIPLYYISSSFRPSQIFFQPYGAFYDKILRRVTHFFVQNQQSLELLYKHSIPQVTVSGDTRFDRVLQTYNEAKKFPEVEKFCASKKIIIAGSTWPDDEKMIVDCINNSNENVKFIIAPHEIDSNVVARLRAAITKQAVCYSELAQSTFENQVLIIDNVGMLSSLYAYAHLAYVGGAFGKGLHNILEPAVFGLPVFFGSNYQKNPEAAELIQLKGAFALSSGKELEEKINELLLNESAIEKIKSINKAYIDKNKGATETVMKFLKMNFI